MPLMLINKEWYLEYKAEIEESQEKVTIDAAFDMSALFDQESILSIGKDSASIKIHGILSRNGPGFIDLLLGKAGTAYKDIIDAVDTIKKEVKAGTPITLNMNTPGGNVDGMDDAFQALASLKGTYPITAINEGMIVSGGIWLASAADRIVATSPTAANGSIGTLTEIVDDTKKLENEGIKRHVLTNREGTKKHLDASTDDGQDGVRDVLDAVYGVFTDRVTAGRPITKKQIDGLQGRVILAKEALEIGLLDEIVDGQSNAGLSQKTPASAGMKGHTNMSDLEKLLAENPVAAAEFKKLKTEAFDAGKLSMETKIKQLSPYLAEDSGYSGKIKTMILKGITGEMSFEAAIGAVAAYDAFKEEKVSDKAKTDSDGIPITPPKAPKGSTEGVITNEAEFQAAVKVLRGEA